MNKGKDTKPLSKNKTVLKIATRVSNEKKKALSAGKDKLQPGNEKPGSPEKSLQWEANSKGLSEGAPHKSLQKERKFRALSDVIHKKTSNSEKISINNDARNTKRILSARERSSDEYSDTAVARNHELQKKSQSLEKLTAQQGSVGELLPSNGPRKLVHDVDSMSPDEIKESLSRLKANPIQPFNFLSNIMDEVVADDHTPVEKTKPTEIDLQLAALVRRVELNKVLLERTNQRIKDINFLAERNKMVALRDFSYDEESFLRLKEAGDSKSGEIMVPDTTHPGIDELRRTMDVTLEMLGYVHKIASGDLASGDLPPELTKHMGMDKTDETS